MARSHDLTPGSSPSSTVTIARWTDDAVEVLVLGDSPVVVLLDSGRVDCVRDDRLTCVASDLRARYRDRLAAGSGYDDEHRAIVRQLVVEERQRRNGADEYWITEAVPEAAHHAARRQCPRRPSGPCC